MQVRTLTGPLMLEERCQCQLTAHHHASLTQTWGASSPLINTEAVVTQDSPWHLSDCGYSYGGGYSCGQAGTRAHSAAGGGGQPAPRPWASVRSLRHTALLC